MKNRGGKARRKDCRRKRLGREGERGRAVETNTHSPSQQSPSQQHLGHSRCSLTASYHQLIERTVHNCSAHDQLVFIASNTIGSCTKSIWRSPPHCRVVGGDAHLLVSYRSRQEIWKRSSKHHVATGMSENLVFQGRLSHAQGSNPLERLIKGTSDTHLFYIILSFSIQWNDQVYQYCTALSRLRSKDQPHPKGAEGANISRLL
jgi:hypothetical protein